MIVLGRKTKRPRLLQRDRVFWLWLARSWDAWHTTLGNLPRLMESRSLEEREEFVRAFIAGMKVYPDDELLVVQIRKVPTTVMPQPGNSSVELVEGPDLIR